jgi:penicillin-binding protein 1A
MEDAAGENTDMNADDYTLDTTSYRDIKPETDKPVEEQPILPKKDTSNKKQPADNGAKPEEKKEKKGFFKRLFGGGNKDKDNQQQKSNDY